MKNLSGTKFRQMLRAGDEIPTWYANLDVISGTIIVSFCYTRVFAVHIFVDIEENFAKFVLSEDGLVPDGEEDIDPPLREKGISNH